MTYPIHPAAMLFPMMAEEELAVLAEDIKKNGLLESIVLYEGKILDGRNRQAACERVGATPKFVDANGYAPSPISYVLSKNLHRRHLTISQRAAIAAEATPLFQAEAHKRMVSGTLAPIGTRGKTSSIAARELQVGERTVSKALAVQRTDPEAFERVKRGEITVNEAAGEQAKRHLRDGKASAEQPKTKRQLALAESQKQRMVSALSTIVGLCRGLGEELNLDLALCACSNDDQKLWAGRARESATQLRKFAARLERSTNADSSQAGEDGQA
jgi:hypothetical protein